MSYTRSAIEAGGCSSRSKTKPLIFYGKPCSRHLERQESTEEMKARYEAEINMLKAQLASEIQSKNEAIVGALEASEEPKEE